MYNAAKVKSRAEIRQGPHQVLSSLPMMLNWPQNQGLDHALLTETVSCQDTLLPQPPHCANFTFSCILMSSGIRLATRAAYLADESLRQELHEQL
jgi:hypothetical protein